MAIANCILCGTSIPAHLFGHPRTKFCGPKCRNKAQRTKDRDKRIAYLKAWKLANQERVKELCRASQKRRPEAAAVRRRRWIEKHPGRMRESRARWKKANPGAIAANVRYRQLVKENATPAWLTLIQRKQMRRIYEEAALMTKQTGISHEVDHVVPIRGKLVCGLHVPWNLQVLTAHENHRKSAK